MTVVIALIILPLVIALALIERFDRPRSTAEWDVAAWHTARAVEAAIAASIADRERTQQP